MLYITYDIYSKLLPGNHNDMILVLTFVYKFSKSFFHFGVFAEESILTIHPVPIITELKQNQHTTN